MRCRASAVGLLLLALAAPASAQEKLLIFSDPVFTQDTVADVAPGVVTLYVVNKDHAGQTGVIFSIKPGPGFTGVWLGETSPYTKVGQSATRIDVGYGTCLLPPVLVLTMTYQLFGTSSPCSELRTAPADGFTINRWLIDGLQFRRDACCGRRTPRQLRGRH